MKTRSLIIGSAVLWTWACLANDNPTAAVVVLVGHALFWTLHRVEVKLNRLLDEKRIRVSEAELAD